MPGKNLAYRVIEPTGDGATDTAAYSAWLAVSPRPLLHLAPNGNNLVINSAPAVVSSGNFRIEGNGVTMVHQFSSAPLLNVQRAMTSPQDTATIAEDVDHDISGTSVNTLSTRVTLTTAANVANYPVGSFVLLSSEDVAPHASAAENGRMGQVMRVAKIDAALGYVYFATTAWRTDLYTTDIRLTGLPTGETYINNLKFNIAAGSGEDIELRTSPVMWLENCVHPVVNNCDIIESASAGLVAFRCVGGEFANSKVRKIRFSTGEGGPNNSRLGYGVFMASCDGFAVRDSFFTNCRHGVSANWRNASAAGATSRHGANHNILIADNIAAFTKGAGFDTHSDGVNNLMVGNVVYGARTDTTGLGCGYQLRGESNVMIGNSDYDCEVGIQVFENTIDGTQDAVIQGHTSRAKKIGMVFEGHASSTRKLNVNVIGGLFETKQIGSAAGVVVQATRSKVNFQGVTLKPRGQNGGKLFDMRGDVELSGDVVYDPHNAAGAWVYQATTGSNNNCRVTVKRDADDIAPGDAAYVVTDTVPDVISFATTLTADRAVTFSCNGRKRVLIKRSAAGAFNLNITHSGGVQALVENEAAEFLVHGATVMMVSPVISLAP
jgi:hypothetical protein